MTVLSNLEQCKKYEITITKFLGLKNNTEGNKKNQKVPIFTGETSASLNAYTTIDSSLPFKVYALKVNEELSSIDLLWSTKEWPCIDMYSMLRFQICESKEKSTCFQDGVIKKVEEADTPILSTNFNGLKSCTSYLVRLNIITYNINLTLYLIFYFNSGLENVRSVIKTYFYSNTSHR